MDTFALPFRFVNGNAATLTDGTNDYYLQILSSVLRTEPGEMALDENFGINDPVFQRINKGSIVELASKYVPELAIDNVSSIFSEDGTERVVIQYRNP